ncbi:hypothetical protein IAD21_01042 [Abditibacteriota bacterium]|nr:hypothetical protein IAD21_01042 [Abditibacteriota bacterium]
MPFCFVLFYRPDFELNEAEMLLSGRGLLINRAQDYLLVKWHEGPELRVFFAEGEDVRREAEEIASRTSYKAKVSGFDRRFEIGFDDLDEVLDEINTLIEVQLSLQEATGGFLFNSWNGQLTAPDE